MTSGLQVIPLLIDCGFRASLPVGIAWAATHLASRSSAATRYFVWACAISTAALLPLATLVTPRWRIAGPVPLARLASGAGIEAAPSIIPSVAPTERIGVDAADEPKDRRPSGLTLWIIATWIWITGAVVVFSYALMGHFAAWRLYRTTRMIQGSWIEDAEQLTREAGLNSPFCVVESAAVSAPLVLHLWHPIIVMPEAAGRWSRARLRAVLLHELAHIKRNDLHVQSLAQLVCAVLSGLRSPIAIKGQPPVRGRLAEEMAQSHVPGISIAVIDNSEIAWARGFGIKEAGKTEPVTTSTLFEAQSISKAVTATAALVLVNSGRLSLEESPNVYLKSWKLPYNEYQAHEKVTLRRVLSHSSGG
jgi:Beta-lactamase/BlaR1 peptidase M56